MFDRRQVAVALSRDGGHVLLASLHLLREGHLRVCTVGCGDAEVVDDVRGALQDDDWLLTRCFLVRSSLLRRDHTFVVRHLLGLAHYFVTRWGIRSSFVISFARLVGLEVKGLALNLGSFVGLGCHLI